MRVVIFIDILIEHVLDKDLKKISQINVENWESTYKGILSEDILLQVNEYKMREKWLNFFKREDTQILVAKCNNFIAGFIAVSLDKEIEDTLYIDSLHVDNNYRGKGIGTALLSAIFNKSENKNYSICVFTDNKKARDLYIRLGAVHLKYFTDNFYGFPTSSEKLIWNNK